MEPLPKDSLGQQMCKLFPYRWNWIEALNEHSSSAPKWATCTKHPIKARALWVKYQDAATIVGVRFGAKTQYAMIDIDAGSRYIDQLPLVLAALETIGLVRAIVLRSSFSGGLHIYLPLPKPYATFSVACAVAGALEAQGLVLAPGDLEVFPNRKPYAKSWEGQFSNYLAHRLPLQPGTGSCILTSDLQPVANGGSLSLFFALWDNASLLQDAESFDQALTVARANRRNRRRAAGPVESWRADLELLIKEGWTSHGQTNALLKEFACYGRVFLGLAGVELAEYVEKTATNAPGFERWCRHTHEIWRRSCVWAKAVEGYYWPLGSTPLRERRSLATVCQERANDARQRIATAVEHLRGHAANVKQLAKEICRAARCSQSTLYKNLDIWHPCPPKPVTPDRASGVGPMGSILMQIRESLETAERQWVTGLGGDNETYAPESRPKKNLKLPWEGGGPGGEGFSPCFTDG